MEISGFVVAFAVFTVLTLGGGLGVVNSRNLIHAALYLIVSLFGVAGYFVLLEAPFLATVQVLVYIGAIAILVIFGVMLTRSVTGGERTRTGQWIAGAIASVGLLATLGFTLMGQFGDVTEPVDGVAEDMVVQLGTQLVSPNAFVLPFEVASVLLLAALIGSVVLARE